MRMHNMKKLCHRIHCWLLCTTLCFLESRCTVCGSFDHLTVNPRTCSLLCKEITLAGAAEFGHKVLFFVFARFGGRFRQQQQLKGLWDPTSLVGCSQ